jgi:hypothetical protein
LATEANAVTLSRMKYFVLALLICLPLFAWAQSDNSLSNTDFTGNDYVQMCVPSPAFTPTELTRAVCRAWMKGLLGGFYAAEANAHINLFETQDGVTTSQVEKIAAKWMNDHPEDLHLTASVLVLYSLKDTFPIKQPVKK